MSEKFDTVVTVIEESKVLTQLTISELIVSKQIHEDKMSRRDEASRERAFQTNHKISSFKIKNKQKGAYQINVVLSMPNMVKKGVSFLHVQYARKQITLKRIAGTRETPMQLLQEIQPH